MAVTNYEILLGVLISTLVISISTFVKVLLQIKKGIKISSLLDHSRHVPHEASFIGKS